MKKKPEIYKDVPGWEGLYQVSNWGNIKSLPREKGNDQSRYTSGEEVLNPYRYKGDGHRISTLKGPGKKPTNLRIGRMVATLFIREPKKGEQVNHKDLDKANDYVDNLEWVTPSENIKHSWDNDLLRGSRAKAIEATNLATGEVTRYDSRLEACAVIGIGKKAVTKSIQNKTPTKGYIFKHLK